ncbi:enhancer of polycomb-like-domain-containing protein [Amylocystis lapponica]|nr:enhancer of polycomb-like-domain-containing protein [Amylocystis lapponica]
MPRNHNAGPSTLRNRNRVTNKTRLRVITEAIDADPIVLDEDEEKARVVSTAGVDAEDANEHHLQAVLSAAAYRHQAGSRSTRAASEKEKAAPAAYIPTPDSTGLVDNYEELYPPSRWKDPATYVKSSDTIEEACSFALSNGFIYYMDERDKEWLDKNNEEARGEGTSAQGAVSQTNTRSGRSAKGKGKDPDVNQSVVMSEDEFELVMALFEKITHEKTEFLHHGLEQGATFPPFSDYQDTPKVVPEPSHMLRFARVVYPYWRERRLERVGHRIIPMVNLDETDTLNESYICFRRREIKAVRKTRAQQATYSDKLLRLQTELGMSLEMALAVRRRELTKRGASAEGKAVWNARLALVEVKRKFSALNTKEDDDLLYDKERPVKKPKAETRIPLKLRTRDNGDLASPVTYNEPQIRPKERQAQIRSQIEQEMARIKERNNQWEDLVDNPYQPPSVPYPSRLFKVVPPHKSLSSTDNDDEQPKRSARAVRLRYGRGGRLYVDRRFLSRPAPPKRSRTHEQPPDSDSEAPEDEAEDQERSRTLEERWKYDDDDEPAVGPNGADEQDRMLVDDYDTKFIVQRMLLFSEQEANLKTDPTLLVATPDGRQQAVVPSALATPMPRPMPRPTPSSSSAHGSAHLSNGMLAGPSTSNGASVAVAKKMAPPISVPQMRISSGGGMRLIGTPTLPALPNMHPNGLVPLTSPHNTPPNSAGQLNGFHDVNSLAADDGESDADGDAFTASATSPLRTKAHNSQPVSTPTIPNGYHMNPTNAYPANIANVSPYMLPAARPHTLSVQQMQNIKSAFAAMSPPPDATTQVNAASTNLAHRSPASYIAHGVPTGANYSMPLAVARQIQWAAAAAQQQQRPPSVNTGEANGIEGIQGAQASPPLPGTPARVPSANGMRAMPLQRNLPVQAANHQMGAMQGRASPANGHIARLGQPHSPLPHMLSPSLNASQPQVSPTRSPQPPLASPSPSLQSRQVVGGSGAGY